MPRALRNLLILLLALPAILVPRGVGLDWCLCGMQTDCCVATVPACCAGETAPDGPALASDEDCACCKRLEVDEFELVGATAAVQDDGALPAFSAPPAPARAPRVDVRVARCAPRAPPALVTPAGLLPGTRPLLL